MIVVNSSTRQFNIPGADLVFGVESDSGSVIKEFQCPRYVGNNLDLTGCFIRMNYRNANGEIDSYLVKNVAVDGDNVVFGWELAPKVTMYKGNVSFVMCVVGPDTKVKWHTTLGRGQVLEGLEPDEALIEEGTADVVAALIAMVEAQTEAVENKGAEWVRNVQSEGTDQIIAVQTAARESREAAVAQIEAKGVNTRNSIPADYTALSETVDGLMRSRAGAIICEAAGSAIVVNDASDLPIQGMKIFGRSTQDGTPTPDAPVEIKSVVEPVVTVAGKNLVGIAELENECFTVGDDGVGVLTYVETGSKRFTKQIKRYLPANTPITVSVNIIKFNDTQQRWYLRFIDGGNNRAVMFTQTGHCSETVVLEKPAKALDVYLAPSDVLGDSLLFSDLQIEIGDVVSNYESFDGIQTISTTRTLPGIPVTSGGNYTDENGQQWICDEVDLERGVYVQRIGSLTFTGEESWSKSQYYENTVQKSRSGLATGSAYLCNMYAETTLNVNHGVVIGGAINVRDDVYAVDVEAWKSHLRELYSSGNPVVIIGALTDPTETPLSETEIAAYRAMHSNYPNTTVLNDSGAHMVVKYAADTKLYIDNKIAALVGG